MCPTMVTAGDGLPRERKLLKEETRRKFLHPVGAVARVQWRDLGRGSRIHRHLRRSIQRPRQECSLLTLMFITFLYSQYSEEAPASKVVKSTKIFLLTLDGWL